MNCPVCNRLWATALSVCPSCGSDIYSDENQLEIIGVTVAASKQAPSGKPAPSAAALPAVASSPAVTPPKAPTVRAAPDASGVAVARGGSGVAAARVQVSPQKSIVTGSLTSPKTSPTLVGLPRTDAVVPEWRVQMQNAVRKRRSEQPGTGADADYPTNGATALRPQVVKSPEPPASPTISDPVLANAMRRIEDSRKNFLDPEPVAAAPLRERPFAVVTPNGRVSKPSERVIAAPKPRLVEPPPPIVVVAKRDTNKLPPIETIVSSEETAEDVAKSDAAPSPEFAEIKLIRIKAENAVIEQGENRSLDEIEDLAPISMRFGAGVFDLIIGSFAGMLILSPIAFTSSDWFTMNGLITLLAVSGLVLFIYMTVCLGFFGKTLGMRLFSLELVDAVENEYPTLRQAAVNSSVFLLLLGFAGAGFLTLFYNEEKRALHDLLSGTILVREF